MPKIMKNKRLRPQNGQRLRELREQRGLRQAAFADEINAHMRNLLDSLPTSEMLTQSMVSDLELGNADLSILHLFTISDFFGVTPAALLVSDLSLIHTGEVTVNHSAAVKKCEMSGSHPYLCALGERRFLVCSSFPSELFSSARCFDCYVKGSQSGKEHVEFYPLDTLISFLFSPVGLDCKQTKLQTLEQMQQYFSSSIYRRLYFIPSHLHSRMREPCMSIEPEGGAVTLLFPAHSGNISHVAVNNPQFAEELYRYYHQGTVLIHDALSLLAIAHQTLLLDFEENSAAAMCYFYKQCVTRTRYADWIRECFTPEVQQMLVGDEH